MPQPKEQVWVHYNRIRRKGSWEVDAIIDNKDNALPDPTIEILGQWVDVGLDKKRFEPVFESTEKGKRIIARRGTEPGWVEEVEEKTGKKRPRFFPAGSLKKGE